MTVVILLVNGNNKVMARESEDKEGQGKNNKTCQVHFSSLHYRPSAVDLTGRDNNTSNQSPVLQFVPARVETRIAGCAAAVQTLLRL